MNTTEKTTKTNGDVTRVNLIDDCRLMLEYALADGKDLAEGKILSADLRRKVSKLDQLLVKQGAPPISGIPQQLVTAAQPEDSSTTPLPGERDPTELLLDIHDSLSTLIAPATPRSLRATSKDRWWHVKMPAIVFVAIIVASLCMIGFIVTLPKPDKVPKVDTVLQEPVSTIDGGTNR